MSQPVFYYDLADPVSYLAAERINATLAVVPEWEPVLGSALALGRAAIDRAAIEDRAREIGALPFRWWPRGGDAGHVAGIGEPPGEIRRATTGTAAALAATYAKQVGRVVAFSLAAFRQAFAGGNDLDLESTVLLAGAACELHPRALLQAISRPAIDAALQRACDRAKLAGVTSLPAIEVRGSLFSGDDAVEQAAEMIKPSGGPAATGHAAANGAPQVSRGPLSQLEDLHDT